MMQKANTKHKINFRKWADGDKYGPYCVILRVPKSILFEKATDAISTYLIAKLWLAILTRMDQPTSERKPCFLIMDEPHQFLGSARGGIKSTWGQMIVESRKWRLGLIFLIHDWLQMPRELRELIKSAGPHYSLYNTKKEIFKALEEEIKPFTPEEAVKLESYHAINVVQYQGKKYKFLAKMAAPPVKIDKQKRWRHEYIDRSKLTERCSRKFGRPIEVVEDDIYNRESILY